MPTPNTVFSSQPQPSRTLPPPSPPTPSLFTQSPIIITKTQPSHLSTPLPNSPPPIPRPSSPPSRMCACTCPQPGAIPDPAWLTSEASTQPIITTEFKSSYSQPSQDTYPLSPTTSNYSLEAASPFMSSPQRPSSSPTAVTSPTHVVASSRQESPFHSPNDLSMPTPTLASSSPDTSFPFPWTPR